MMRRSLALVVVLLAAGAMLAAEDLVVCVLCGDYMFEKKDAQTAIYEGKQIYLCSLKELAALKANPDKYVWGIDQVTGKRVHKMRTEFTADRRVKVRKKDGKNEVCWPRRFFFESQKNRDEFLRNPAKYLKEPYAV